jgi:hypothetical protein
MSFVRIQRWYSEEPRRPPAAIACALADDRFWKDERRRLIGTHPDWPDAAGLLELNEALAHALVLVLSRLPLETRRGFADAFYDLRRSRAAELHGDAESHRALAAAVVLSVLEGLDEEICNERTLDLLRGAAQRDDLTRTPAPAVEELRKSIAHIRFNVDFDDAADPRGAAALAIAEVLDPAGDAADVNEVLARCAWTTVEMRDRPAVLGFLLEVDRILADAKVTA